MSIINFHLNLQASVFRQHALVVVGEHAAEILHITAKDTVRIGALSVGHWEYPSALKPNLGAPS